MELPARASGDQLLRSGELLSLRQRLRTIAPKHDLTCVAANAFDTRTRMLPFIYASTHMAPGGVRAIGTAMADSGFKKTRIVLQQWNPSFRPSKMKLDGRVPDIFMVSSMQIHSAPGKELIRDACRIDLQHRPLIITGGPKTIYEPWDSFSADPSQQWSADVAVTGEEFVLLSLLEILLSERASGEPLRRTFIRARDRGLLNNIPGLVYARTNSNGIPEELIDTGSQRLLGDLDELPSPILGYSLLEPPSRRETLSANAVPANLVNKYSPIGALVITLGCKFSCPYCPIPAYNQRQHRAKSGERIADEFASLYKTYGIRRFFGADDNFFNDKSRAVGIVETLARTEINGKPIRKCIRWGTEVTIHDTLLMKDHLSIVRRAGVRALWIGVEDITATLVKKGQSVDKTIEAFQLLKNNGICPMPMMMHHDDQPLVSRGPKPYGLLNQLKIMRKAGAISMQVLMMVPASGSKLYCDTYASGTAYESVGGMRIKEHMLGGNHIVASNNPKPWRKQLNILVAYAYFYNPARLLFALIRPKSRLYLADALAQAMGICGIWSTTRRTIGWAVRLRRGKIVRKNSLPASSIPMCSVTGGAADHALPGTPLAEHRNGRPTVVDANPRSDGVLPDSNRAAV